jgi:molybdopterin-containing oxidoreductase family iron-sulfur binding subunit
VNTEEQNTSTADLARRRFLQKTAVAAAASAVIPGVSLHAAPRSEAVSSKNRWGLLIDANKCADGCTACVDACDEENGIDMMVKPEGASDEEWARQKPRWIRTVKIKDNLTNRVTQLPMMCQHCEHPPCVDVCPTGASFRRADGIVMVDRHTCIGCRYCMMACPYKARSFIHENVQMKPTIAPRGKGCVESCNLCVHRLDNGDETTACQQACDKAGHQAIVYGDLHDPNSEISQALEQHASTAIRGDLKLNPGVRYRGI